MARGVRKDVAGQRFGRLIALQDVGVKKDRHHIWRCICDCGAITEVAINQLTMGKTQSCGCLQRETASIKNTTHGMRRHYEKPRLYRIWLSMKDRCYNSNNKCFNSYGGRGITVCDEWKNDYIAFYEWAMKNGYADTLSIDRINNDGNYEPENCRWATSAEQSRNTSRNRIYQIDGEKLCRADVSKKYGVSISAILWRTEHKGMNIKEAIGL